MKFTTAVFFVSAAVANARTVPNAKNANLQHTLKNGTAAKLGMNDPTTASELAKSYYDNHTPVTPHHCDHYCGVWYGLPSSGFNTAAAHWAAIPASYKLGGYEEGGLSQHCQSTNTRTLLSCFDCWRGENVGVLT